MKPVVEYLPDGAVDERTDRLLRELFTACFTKPQDVVFRTRRFFRTPYPHRWIILDEKNLPIAHLGAHERTIESGRRKFQIGGICEVCVSPDFRGRGYVKLMMANALPTLAEIGCVFAVLFGIPEHYTSSGFSVVPNLVYGGGAEGWTPMDAMVRELGPLPWPAGEVRLPGLTF